MREPPWSSTWPGAAQLCSVGLCFWCVLQGWQWGRWVLPCLAPGGGCICAYEKLRCETLPFCFCGASRFVCLGKNQSILRRVVQGTTRQKKLQIRCPIRLAWPVSLANSKSITVRGEEKKWELRIETFGLGELRCFSGCRYRDFVWLKAEVGASSQHYIHI